MQASPGFYFLGLFFILLPMLIPAVIGIAIGPGIIGILTRLKVRQTINQDAPERHRTKQGTPTMGGLIILFSAVAGVIILSIINKDDPVWKTEPGTLGAAIMMLAFAGLGFLDDYLSLVRGKNLGLKARQKLLGQFILAGAFMLWIARTGDPSDITKISLGLRSINLGWFYYPLAVLMIVGMSNAVNLTDGLDGLVGGLAAAVSVALALLISGTDTIMQTPSYVLALAGGCLGFLWHNRNPARVFMGDTGSLAIGAGLAGFAIAGKQEVGLLALGAIFIFEALSVIIQVVSFKTTGKRVFKMTPIHHHFELSGWSERKIVGWFWAAQALICVAVLALMGS
jgi:phospho-N-acetylmuramoyl-pentapeptide-transferase